METKVSNTLISLMMHQGLSFRIILFALVMMWGGVNVKADNTIYVVSGSLTSGTYSNVTDCSLTIGNDTYIITSKENDDTDYKSTFTNYAEGASKANGTSSSVPTSGTFYKLSPTTSGSLTVGIYLPKRNKLIILDVKGTTSITSMKELGSELECWRDVNGTITFDVEAGHSYYFFSPDCSLGFYGYEFIKY